ncbi:related to cell wall mannoprotein [Phialocephala subalpina]|uniref:Related to cell wall mannoprotein n=1 Tax=Phialocephala subalpina TaxID=576137 RepID=A0A1L7XHW6_9HELO|nr:related to cell wall mannoprotein [Phialocephala subalpina]
MKYESASILIAFFGLTSAAPMPAPKNVFSIPRAMLRGREVPQEHSHNRFLDGVRVNLNIDNPAKIQDPVFGLLGNAAAAAGAGSITNLDCLHQATADQAFTNAKAAGNVTGQADALMYAALERNTGSVGLASVICNETAVNPEIEAVQQHQDPASTGAAATNKAVVLALAKQLASIGADPQEALLSGTFAPGKIGDTTGAGNTCDVADDVEGCIFSQNLLVDDATAAEITAAVAGIASSSSSSSASSASNSTAAADTAAASACAASVTATVVSSAGAAKGTATAAATTAGTNVQTFTGTLGGAAPPVISSSGTRPFTVNGNTFVGEGAALQRSCSIQNTACSNAANSGSLAGTSVADCNAQETACNAAASAKVKRAALDFGTCSDPAIEFAAGLDGRTENSFQAVNQVDFNHGSALNIGVIASFVCQQLSSSCKAGADAIAACATAQTAAAAATGQAAADAFNSALGVSAAKLKFQRRSVDTPAWI